MNDYFNPDWGNARKVHDWKNHIPDFIIEKWESYSDHMKRDFYLWATELADNEAWD